MFFAFHNNSHILRILSVLIFACAGIGFSGADVFAQSGPLGISVAPKIVFGSSRNGGNHDIFTMDLDGSNQTRLTTSLAYDDQPKWSPDSFQNRIHEWSRRQPRNLHDECRWQSADENYEQFGSGRTATISG